MLLSVTTHAKKRIFNKIMNDRFECKPLKEKYYSID